MSDGGWLAVKERPDEDHDHRYPWFPALEVGGSSYPLPVWFATEDECEAFIRDTVIGKGLLS